MCHSVSNGFEACSAGKLPQHVVTIWPDGVELASRQIVSLVQAVTNFRLRVRMNEDVKNFTSSRKTGRTRWHTLCFGDFLKSEAILSSQLSFKNEATQSLRSCPTFVAEHQKRQQVGKGP